MKKLIALAAGLAVLTAMFFCFDMYSFASQTTDIEKTQILGSTAYYEFDAKTKTLTIGGTGAIPNLTNSNTGAAQQPWFSWKADGSIGKIVIEEGITSIGNYCLYGADVSDISLPHSLESIGSYAFAYNSALKSIDISNVKTISNNAFASCTGLREIYIPSSTTYIGHDAFNYCKSLEKVEFERMGSGISIDRNAFLKCQSLKRVDVPRYATIGAYAFGHKSESKGAVYDDFVLGVYSDSRAYTFAKNSFLSYAFLTSMNIYENDVLPCSYYNNVVNGVTETNTNEKITYYFTPEELAMYSFYSTGDVDVDCTLKDDEEKVICVGTDNSAVDLNFTLDTALEAGKTYSFVVESIHSTGNYELCLKRLSVTGNAYGVLKVLDAPNGNVIEDSAVPFASIYDGNGDYLGKSDENGCFSVENAYELIRIVPQCGCERTVYLKYAQPDLGDVAIVTYDCNRDSYVNAKDFAIMSKMFGENNADDVSLKSLDRDKNGIIDDSDWQAALPFLQYGQIDDAIYNNLA